MRSFTDNVIPPPPVISVKSRAIPQPGEVIAIAQQFLRTLQSRGRSKNTLSAYESDLDQLINYLHGRGMSFVQHITGEIIEGFLDTLIQRSGIKPVTAARKRETLRSFFAYCCTRSILNHNPVEHTQAFIVTPSRVIAPTYTALLTVIEGIPADTTLGKRDRAYFRLLFDAALRASAPCMLDIFDDTNPPINTVLPSGLVVFTNKGGRVESNPIDDITQEYLADWLAVRRRWAKSGERALFVNRAGERITRQGMHARCKALGAAAGMPHLHLHLFRHSRAGGIIETLGLRDGAEFLHHRNINTTQQIYGHYGEVHRHRRIRAHCPLSGPPPKVSP